MFYISIKTQYSVFWFKFQVEPEVGLTFMRFNYSYRYLHNKQKLNSIFSITPLKLNSIYPGGGGSILHPFCCDKLKKKYLKLKLSDYSNQLHMPITKSWDFIPTAWVIRHIALMPYFTYTKLNLYLDLLHVIGKPIPKASRFHIFCKKILHRFLDISL